MKKWCVVLGVSILAGSLTGCLSKPDTAETTQQAAETTAQAAHDKRTNDHLASILLSVIF